ncbi:GNAT family N-acetyltransferase [Deinococcus pimensis]|uniref:GNAT family N-acetyltransferase n=1 Tax=Deinococcus pimensis TaxID=309888 RepID=UPI0005EAD96A|nr:GNAT family N-acetyltransferase [Deinococcus pimensis]
MTLLLRVVTADALQRFSALLRASAEALERRGTPLWTAASLTEERLLASYPLSALRFAVLPEGEEVATLVLLDHDEEFWPDARPHEALYLHKLAVRPERQGRGYGEAALDAASREARARGRALLRLDTAADRANLRAFYERLGFEPRGERDVQGLRVVLYERRV